MAILRGLVVLWLIWGSLCWPAAGQAAGEYQIKAVFLFRFAQFVEWPAVAFPTPDSPIIIGVLGTDPFRGSLEDVVRNERVRGRELQVHHYQKVEQIQNCHILFISTSEDGRLNNILARLKARSILTVGETEGFAKTRGGMVRFITEQNRIRLRG